MLHSYITTIALLGALGSVASWCITGASTGINTTTGERPLRYEINTFQNSGAAWDLYILSLAKMQSLDQSNMFSYYQISGIHGRPFVQWDGVQGPYQAGYCTHGSILFPSWHRPYLGLFEQVISIFATDLVKQYPLFVRSIYFKAGQTLRVPYWDWAANATMPSVVNQPFITVNAPTGQQTIPNPLYSYVFHPRPSASDFPPSDGSITRWNQTVRSPNGTTQSQPSIANAQLKKNSYALTSLTYQLIADPMAYAPWSNTAYTDSRGNRYNSIENMHNAIHGLVGYGGHMSNIPYSAFDPIFWLHHANMDRLIAMYQAIYPNNYTTSQASAGTFTNTPGSIEDINTPLTPFHNTTGTSMHTSVTARNIKDWGYSYPEIIDWNVNASALSTNVRTALNRLYNPSGAGQTKRDLLVASQDLVKAPQQLPSPSRHKRSRLGRFLFPLKRRSPVFEMGMDISAPSPAPALTQTSSSSIAVGSATYQYLINIEVKKAALRAAFQIHFFLGRPPKSASTFSQAKNLVGTQYVLFSPSMDFSAAQSSPDSVDRGTGDSMTYGQLPLNLALTDPSVLGIRISSLEPKFIVPILQGLLSYRISLLDETLVPLSSVPSLKVTIVGRLVAEPTTGQARRGVLPNFGALQAFAKISSSAFG